MELTLLDFVDKLINQRKKEQTVIKQEQRQQQQKIISQNYRLTSIFHQHRNFSDQSHDRKAFKYFEIVVGLTSDLT